MDILIAISLNLFSALLGFWIGWLWQVLKKTIRYRRAKRFWRPFLNSNTQVVVGRFSEFTSFEPVGFLGVGCAIGLTELRAYFMKLGWHEFNIAYADQLSGDALKTNLILIGGPDANDVSKEVLSKIKKNIRFGDPNVHNITLYDTVNKKMYTPLRSANLEDISTDYGAIIRTANPFAPEKQVLLIAGSFGYGTWAGIRFAMSEQFIKNKLILNSKSIECLLEVDVVRKTPQDVRPIFLREVEVTKDVLTEKTAP